jgi:hypothetical protein
MGTSKQPKKRLVIDISPAQHAELSQRAAQLQLSLSNMIRRALLLPDEQARARVDLPDRKSKLSA